MLEKFRPTPPRVLRRAFLPAALVLVVGPMLAAILIVAFAPAGADQGPARHVLSHADSIVLVRTGCYGECVPYRLRVTRLGGISFRSAGVDSLRAADRISKLSYAELLRRAERVRFESFPRRIRGSSFCGRMATDFPSAEVRIHVRDTIYAVDDYLGCRPDLQATASAKRLTELRAFEQALDDAADSDRWVDAARAVARERRVAGAILDAHLDSSRAVVWIAGSRNDSGTLLFVNGDARGAAFGLREIAVPAGRVRISMRRNGCRDWDTTVAVRVGAKLVVRYRSPNWR
jgi:hypothetical protein